MILNVSNATKSYGSQLVFEHISFTIQAGEKIALVGRNGCGKTTLIRCITDQESLDSGEIHKAKNLRIGLLSQVSFNDENQTVAQIMDEVFAPVYAKATDLENAQNRLASDHSTAAMDHYVRIEHEYEQMGGYTIHSEMMSVLTQFGISENDLDRPIASFSGGERTRIGFAKLLLSKPDILMLDEPTNHLDLPTIQWLEGYLKKYEKAILLVSHDRMFLDRIVDMVYEIEYGHMTGYKGNYSSFVEQKKKNFELQSKRYRNQQKEIQRMEALIEKFRYKASKAAFAQSKIKYLERMDKIDDPQKADTQSFSASFECARSGGKSVVEFDELTVGYDHPLFRWSYNIRKGQRIALIGENGCGKSTFLKTLVGMVQPLSGAFLLGHQIDIGYFDQQLAQLNSGKTVLDELWDDYPQMGQTEIRTVLGHFLFTADEVFKTVDQCSGGEKVRLSLAKLLLKKANFLVLDEPTNHLDILGKETLEDALMDYEGTILFVSHDRYFIEKIATDIASIKDGKVEIVERFDVGEKDKGQKEKVNPVKMESSKAEVVKPRIILINVQREIKKLEALIDEKEGELEALRELRFEPEYYQDSSKMAQLDETIDDKHNEIAHLMDQWQSKCELIEQVQKEGSNHEFNG